MARKRIIVEPSGYSILVVDDQEETLVSSKLLLEREGHRVLTAVGGREALSLINEEQFDLIVVDYFMPQMNGEELVRAIRKIDADVQIILQTGYSGESRRARCSGCSISRVITTNRKGQTTCCYGWTSR